MACVTSCEAGLPAMISLHSWHRKDADQVWEMLIAASISTAHHRAPWPSPASRYPKLKLDLVSFAARSSRNTAVAT